jgi:hypothetical protein
MEPALYRSEPAEKNTKAPLVVQGHCNCRQPHFDAIWLGVDLLRRRRFSMAPTYTISALFSIAPKRKNKIEDSFAKGLDK